MLLAGLIPRRRAPTDAMRPADLALFLAVNLATASRVAGAAVLPNLPSIERLPRHSDATDASRMRELAWSCCGGSVLFVRCPISLTQQSKIHRALSLRKSLKLPLLQ